MRWSRGFQVLLAAAALATTALADVKGEMEWEGRSRTFEVHVPPSYDGRTPTPVVFTLHGGGGNARRMRKLAPDLNDLADREGFICVYPEGVDKHWNDGRGLRRYEAQRENVDDVGFLNALRKRLEGEYNVDPRRVYAMGISNGAFMTYRLAAGSPATVAAIGVVAGAMTVPLAEKYPPTEPVPVIMISGTDDPMVPYNGGQLRFVWLKLGEALSQDETLALWRENNGCDDAAVVTAYPDRDADDGTTVTRAEYSSPNGGDVVFVKVEGGGHTWPGGWQYLPEKLVGKTSRDIDAGEVIWAFVQEHPRQ